MSYVWHLSKNWRPEWGGALYWAQNDHAVAAYPHPHPHPDPDPHPHPNPEQVDSEDDFAWAEQVPWKGEE